MDTETKRIVAENVEKLLKLRGWSEEQLAAKCGRSQRGINGVRRGEKAATLDTLGAIAEAFRVPAWALLVPNLDPSAFNERDFTRIAETVLKLPAAARASVARIVELEAQHAAAA